MTSGAYLFIKKYQQQCVVFAGLLVLSAFFSFVFYFNSGEAEKAVSYTQISDMIPENFVMAPIELENHTAISSLIPSHGVVDLYQSVLESSRPYKIAESVRIIRSSADQFTVLIPENQAMAFVRAQSVFHAVVQNSKESRSQIYPIPVKRKRLIRYEDDGE